jgi:hypothetical protein
MCSSPEQRWQKQRAKNRHEQSQTNKWVRADVDHMLLDIPAASGGHAVHLNTNISAGAIVEGARALVGDAVLLLDGRGKRAV